MLSRYRRCFSKRYKAAKIISARWCYRGWHAHCHKPRSPSNLVKMYFTSTTRFRSVWHMVISLEPVPWQAWLQRLKVTAKEMMLTASRKFNASSNHHKRIGLPVPRTIGDRKSDALDHWSLKDLKNGFGGKRGDSPFRYQKVKRLFVSG